ncbi:hypothetical protein O1611_g3901 [Lasiodiplodia mahajangana]|uniref:Uncharacterized protein n=1 Tax=Lasiodiplodia mahajangana TaxID=1108764 RepID=A0ACC2JQV4_9PEZI|nr:hypothetical protein O1611_g3901 [Lasiodiplodia mahajangana]
MNLHEKVDYWRVEDDVQSARSPSNCADGGIDAPPYQDPNVENEGDRNSQASDSAPDENVDAHLNRHHKFPSKTTARHGLLSRLRRERDLVLAGPDIITKISETILSSLPPHHVNRKTPSKTYTIGFEVDWDPQEFIREQEYEEEAGEAIGMALTLTGSTKDAQALSCAQYLAQTWPSTGNQIVQLMQDVVRSGNGSQDLPGNTMLTASIQGSKLIAEASGTAYSLAEIGEQLAWLGAALRVSPERHAVVYCEPELMPVNANSAISSSYDRCYNINFKLHLEAKSPSPPTSHCWLDLFDSPVIVEGYPILARPEYTTGLEIALSTAAVLSQAHRAAIFNGRVFVKGFCAMFTLVKHQGDVFVWHLAANKDRSYISYLDHGLSCPPSYDTDKIDLSGLRGARHIVGWCQDAKNSTGEPNASHTAADSRVNSTTGQPRPGPLISDRSSIILAVTTTFIALIFNPNFYWRVLLASLLITLVYLSWFSAALPFRDIYCLGIFRLDGNTWRAATESSEKAEVIGDKKRT